ncbi:MAG TPA: hypothetical protein VN495_01955 [Candidatus Paceibacterota bacterium]|nr:hypothetical protein [Candidatus Paceibacterota bacterium]
MNTSMVPWPEPAAFSVGFGTLTLGEQLRMLDSVVAELLTVPSDRRHCLEEMSDIALLTMAVERGFPLLKLRPGSPLMRLARSSVGLLSEFRLPFKRYPYWQKVLYVIAISVAHEEEAYKQALAELP